MDLSVIIPAHNAQGSIAACLRSVTRCPRDSIRMECLVIDDGSTDDTAAIVKRYIQRDARIKLTTRETGGRLGAMGVGVGEAGGRYIIFLDAYDKLCEDAWEQIEAAVDGEYADFVAFGHIVVCKNGKMKAAMIPIRGVVSTDRRAAARLVHVSSPFNGCRGKIFRRDIIMDNGIMFHTELPSDGEYSFVKAYFDCCGSFMLTKAMIVYCMEQGAPPAKGFGIKKKLGRLREWFSK